MVQADEPSVHLEELRRRLFVILGSLAIFTFVGFCFSDFLLNLIVRPVSQSVDSLYFLSPYEAFLVRIKVSVASSVMINLPVIFYHFWAFVRPGLYRREARVAIPVISISVLFFVI